MKTIIIGGGPAGMISAITSAKQGNETILLEQNNSLGKKLLITGKGRCNITSSLDMDEFIQNIPGNGRFLYSAFQNFTNQDIIDLLKNNGLEVKIERGNRIFPVTDRAVDVLNCLIDELKKNNVKIKTNSKVSRILVEENKVNGVELENSEKISCDKVILATGGKSYPVTGSDGNGYNLAKKLGHTITEIKPSIVPLKADEYLCQSMQGLSLKNVKITIKDEEKNKKIYDDFGEMLFTHYGISGPIVLSSSSHILRVKNIEQKLKDKKISFEIDLKPALSDEKLELRIQRDFEKFTKKQFKNSLNDLLPNKLIPIVIELSKIEPEKQVNQISKTEIKTLVQILKHFKLTIKKFRPVEEAIITAGGINIKEINSSTMESKIVNGLYFAGEVIDVDSYTGGFNLQIAWSTRIHIRAELML